MGYVGWGLVAEQANTTTGGAQRTVGITSSPGAGIAQSSLNAVNNGGGGVVNNYGAVWDNLFVRQYLFGNGEQGAWFDPSDFQPNWRRNLLQYTEQFDNAYWTKSNATVTANTAIAPNGTLTADLIVFSSVASNNINRMVSGSLTFPCTSSLYFKYAGVGQWFRFMWYDGSGNQCRLWFDAINGVIGTAQAAGTATYVSSGIQSEGDGWFRIFITGSQPASSGFFQLSAQTGDGSIIPANGELFLYGAQLETGTQATAYQPITDGVQDYFTYQPQPILYQDSAGTTPVTSLEQPCGLMLDKSRGLQLGPELVTNGDFSNGVTSWTGVNATLSQASGACVITADGAGQARASQIISTVAGRWYEARATLARGTGLVNLDLLIAGIVSSVAVSSVTPTDVVVRFAATATTTTIRAGSSGTAVAGTTYIVDNISVKELPGNHAYQTTSSKRPVVSARVNLLTYTEQFDNAAWSKIATTVTANSTLAPNGTLTADTLTSTGNFPALYQDINTTAGNLFTFRYSIRKTTGVADGSLPTVSVEFRTASTGLAEYGAVVNTNTGQLIAASGWGTAGFSSSSIVSDGDYWTITGTTPAAPATTTIVRPYIGVSGGYVNGTRRITAFPLVSIIVWAADLRPADQANGTIPRYQRVGAATSGTSTSSGVADYDSVGFPVYLRTDGIDDAMLTNSIDFTTTDKMTVWAGVRKLSDAANGKVVELSVTSSSNNGTFHFDAPAGGGNTGFSFRSRGTVSSDVAVVSPVAPTTVVASGLGNISGDSVILRINGTQVASSSADQGTGNYGNYPLYLFARAGTSLFFNGNFYGMIVRGAQTPASLITLTEEYISGVTGFGAPVVVGSPSIGVSI